MVILIPDSVALPAAGVIVTVAGLALIGPLMASLGAALRAETARFPAVLTLMAAASSLALFWIGSAFWGLVLGVLALGAERLAARIGVRRRN